MSEETPNSSYKFRLGDSLLGAQMLFVAFGALVLVPILTGLDPNVALFTAGIGTLVFQVITKGKVPVFLASSFAFIAPIIYGVQTWGIPGTLCGLAAAGVLYIILSFAVRFFGAGILHKYLPPVVTGPVIMVIGLVLDLTLHYNPLRHMQFTVRFHPKKTNLVIYMSFFLYFWDT